MTPFGVKRNGTRITELTQPSDEGAAGITVEYYAGLVPEWEEREAARFSGIAWNVYHAMEYDDKCGVVAYYKMHGIIESHTFQAQRSQMRGHS